MLTDHRVRIDGKYSNALVFPLVFRNCNAILKKLDIEESLIDILLRVSGANEPIHISK